MRPFEEAGLLEAEQARIAVNLDPNDANAHGILAFALFNCREIKRHWITLNLHYRSAPSCAIAHQTRGLDPELPSGHPAKGRESLLLAIQHDPRGMKAARYSSNVGMTYYFEHNYRKGGRSVSSHGHWRTIQRIPSGVIDGSRLRWANSVERMKRATALSEATRERRPMHSSVTPAAAHPGSDRRD